jgi:hypothetical protein
MEDDEEESGGEKGEVVRAVVKGYMQADGTSYCVPIPTEVRDKLGLKGGEQFRLKAKPEEKVIRLKMV